MNKLAIGLVCILFAACSSTKNNVSETNNGASPTSATTNATAANATTTATDANGAATTASSTSAANTAASSSVNAAQTTNKSSVAGGATKSSTKNDPSIYFDYKKHKVKAKFKKVLKAQAALIKADSKLIVTIEGNADERGTDAYNLALGERRARAVQKVLESMGVSPSQLKIVSNGEASPRLACHEEKCWKENRRVDFK